MAINSTTRLELLILIFEFDMSYYQASSVLNLNKDKAKMIYHTFLSQNRAIMAENDKSNARILEKVFITTNLSGYRKQVSWKLNNALQDGTIAHKKAAEIYRAKYEKLIIEPILLQLGRDGLHFLGDNLKVPSDNKVGKLLPLPVPENFADPM